MPFQVNIIFLANSKSRLEQAPVLGLPQDAAKKSSSSSSSKRPVAGRYERFPGVGCLGSFGAGADAAPSTSVSPVGGNKKAGSEPVWVDL